MENFEVFEIVNQLQCRCYLLKNSIKKIGVSLHPPLLVQVENKIPLLLSRSNWLSISFCLILRPLQVFFQFREYARRASAALFWEWE